MPAWIGNLLKGRVSTTNVIGVIFTLGYLYCLTFTVSYLLMYSKVVDKETLNFIKDFLGGFKDVLLIIIGVITGKSLSK
ncbi:hypothetical protein [Runella zeae]|uniref:hypothetical protein n=1 Tax=Runella zeae TaxID=94255 RepID=UPI00040900AA|nr:hypothetical protein [Runella zeae]